MSFSSLKPTPQMESACETIRGLFSRFHKEIGGKPISVRFESNMDAATSIRHLICLTESMICLAKDDVAYVCSANLVARSILETACKTLWILQPVDPFDREWRWSIYLDTASAHYERLSDLKCIPEGHRVHFKQQRQYYAGFSRKIREALIKEGVSEQAIKYPSISQMMKQIANPDLYYFYSSLSAYTHTNFVVVEHYCRNLGTAKQQGVYFKPREWVLPLSLAATCFYLTSVKFLADNDFVQRKHLTRDAFDECLSVVRLIA